MTPEDVEPRSPASSAPEPPPIGNQRIRLARGGALLLEADGFRLIEPRGLKRSPVHAYTSINHLYASGRWLMIGTDETILTIQASDFVAADADADADADAGDEAETAESLTSSAEPAPSSEAARAESLVLGANGPSEAKRLLEDRIDAGPGGFKQLEAMAAVDELGEREGPTFVVWLIVVACLVGTAMQLMDPMLQKFGAFVPELFFRGEYWRATTAHFLHALTPMPGFLRGFFPMFPALPVHLAVNVGGLLVLAHLVERPLGSWRTAMVLAMSGLGTIAGIVLFGHAEVIGASGLVAGLAGSMLALELHFAAAMPVFWRLPRRLFLTVIIVQFCFIDPMLSRYLAGGAHLGGFAGGYFATWALGAPSVASLIPPASLRVGTYCAITLALVGFIGILPISRHDPSALERHARRLLNVSPDVQDTPHDNAMAWTIATEPASTMEGIELSVALAERAVANTGRLHPDVLDTLAEALFQLGDVRGALYTIEEAIRLAPGEPYFYEQRRRFIGDRDPDDRPPPPGLRRRSDLPPELHPSEESLPIDDLPIDPAAPRIIL